MGRRFILGTAMAATGAFLSACFPQPNVYGPPPDLPDPDQTDTSAYETFLDETDSSTLAEEIDTQIESILETESFTVSSEITEGVYGPPSAFDPESEINEDVYGQPEDFN